MVAQLEQKAVETFLPTSQERRVWSDRRVVVEVPLLPGYAFIRTVLTPQTRLRVLQTNGVHDFVSFGGEIPEIPEEEIEGLRLLKRNRVECAEVPFLRVGQRVRLHGGCLDGMEGILVSRLGRKTLVISIDSIRRSLAITVGAYELEVI